MSAAAAAAAASPSASSSSSAAGLPRVLVLGGCGMIGRHLVRHLIDGGLAQRIRVADKLFPEISFMPADVEAIFTSNPAVEYVQLDLTKDAHVARAFEPFADGGQVDFVFNLAGETRFGQLEEVYVQKCFDLSTKCAAAAAAKRVRMFVEVSSAHVYKSQSKRPAKEDAELKPWTTHAAVKLRAEQALQAIAGLNLQIVRPAIVYGVSDVNGIMPRAVCAAVYRRLGETMKFLWDAEMRLNTVHVADVVRALWHVATRVPPGRVFNLADSADSTQGSINSILSTIFGIETGFHGKIISNLARLNLSGVAQEANEKHLLPWTQMIKASGISNTPLTPFIDQELLLHNHLFVDGTAICSTGFTYSHPAPTLELVRQVVDQFITQKLFPPLTALTATAAPAAGRGSAAAASASS